MASNQVAGPGPLSKRTDIGDVQKTQDLPNPDYGEQQAFQALQKAAPMAADSGMAPAAANASAGQVVPLSAPTGSPGEPVTTGADAGPGAGLASLGLPNQPQQDLANLQAYLPVLTFMGRQPGASWAIRNLVRNIKGAGISGSA